MTDSDEEQRTVWCGNLSSRVTEEILYELFLQAAPLQRVHIPKDKDGKQLSYAFITFKHLVSVQYASELLNGTNLYNKRITIKPRVGNNLQKQNPQFSNNAFMLCPRFNNMNTVDTMNALQNLNLLMEMGNSLINSNNEDNYNHGFKNSTPYHQRDRSYHRDDQRDNNRPYRRNYNNHNTNNNRHNRSSHSNNRRNQRKM